MRISSRAGSAARNGQENGSSETPNSRVTTGDSSTLAITVYTAQRANVAPQAGRISCCGQASRISAMLTADRASTSPT